MSGHRYAQLLQALSVNVKHLLCGVADVQHSRLGAEPSPEVVDDACLKLVVSPWGKTDGITIRQTHRYEVGLPSSAVSLDKLPLLAGESPQFSVPAAGAVFPYYCEYLMCDCVDRVRAVGRSLRVVRVPYSHSGLLGLMECLTAAWSRAPGGHARCRRHGC